MKSCHCGFPVEVGRVRLASTGNDVPVFYRVGVPGEPADAISECPACGSVLDESRLIDIDPE